MTPGVFRNGGDEIEVGGDGGFQCFRLEKGRFHHSHHRAVLYPAGCGIQLADIPLFVKAGDVLPRDAGNAGDRDLLLGKAGIEGHVGADHQLAADIQPLDIRGGVGLGIAQPLGILQDRIVVIALFVHDIQNIVGGPIHNAAYFGDLSQPLLPLQIGQPGNAAADCRRGAKPDARFPCDRGNGIVVLRQQLFIGRHDILAGAHRPGEVLQGRLAAAHDLYDGIHFAILQDHRKIGDAALAQLGNGGFIQHIFHGDILPVFQQLVNAAAHRTVTQQCDIHFTILPNGCPSKNDCFSQKGTCISVGNSIS